MSIAADVGRPVLLRLSDGSCLQLWCVMDIPAPLDALQQAMAAGRQVGWCVCGGGGVCGVLNGRGTLLRNAGERADHVKAATPQQTGHLKASRQAAKTSPCNRVPGACLPCAFQHACPPAMEAVACLCGLSA